MPLDIRNYSGKNVRIVNLGKGQHLEIAAMYPDLGRYAHLKETLPRGKRNLEGMTVQPVKIEEVGTHEMDLRDRGYIVDHQTARTLARCYKLSFFLVPCDPVLVTEMPSFLERDCKTDYILETGCDDESQVTALLEDGYKIFGYRRMLVYMGCNAALTDFERQLHQSAEGKSVAASVRERALGLYQQRRTWLNRRAKRSYVSNQEIVVEYRGITYSFKLDATGLSQFVLFLDYVASFPH